MIRQSAATALLLVTLLHAAAQGPPDIVLKVTGHQRWPMGWVSPDGQTLITSDYSMKRWSLATGDHEATQNDPQFGALDTDFCPSTGLMASIGTGIYIQLNRSSDFARVATAVTSVPMYQIRLSPDGGLVAVLFGAKVGLFDGHTLAHVRDIAVSANFQSAVSWSTNGQTLSVWDSSKTYKFFNVGTGALIKSFKPSLGGGGAVFSPDDTKVALGGTHSYIYDWTTGALLKTFGPTTTFQAWIGNGAQILTANTKSLSVWNVADGTMFTTENTAYSLLPRGAVSQDRSLFTIGGNDGGLHVFTLPGLSEVRQFGTHLGSFQGSAYSPDSKWIALDNNADDKNIVVLDGETGATNTVIVNAASQQMGGAHSFFWSSPDVLLFLTNTGYATYSPSNGHRSDFFLATPFNRSGGHASPTSLARVPGTDSFVYVNQGFAFRYDYLARSVLWVQPVTAQPAYAVPSPRADVVAIAGGGVISVRGTSDGHLIKSIAFGLQPQAMAFSPDGSELAASRPDGTLAFYSTSTWSQTRSASFSSTVISVAYAPDGRHLAVAESATRVSVLDAGSLVPVAVYDQEVMDSHVEYSPDSSRLCIGRPDGFVLVAKAP